jgi:hypothetical protein
VKSTAQGRSGQCAVKKERRLSSAWLGKTLPNRRRLKELGWARSTKLAREKRLAAGVKLSSKGRKDDGVERKT